MSMLRATPRVTSEITLILTDAEAHWDVNSLALENAQTTDGLAEIASLSKVRLGDFDRPTAAYKRALQTLFA